MKRQNFCSRLKLVTLTLFLWLMACAPGFFQRHPGVDYPEFERLIAIPQPTPAQAALFNAQVLAESTQVVKSTGQIVIGFKTQNQSFLHAVMEPILAPYLPQLAQQHPVEIINHLALFGHEIYQRYFGRDFYRWAGDIFDLDDPQAKGIRSHYRYGLDCSGFSALPYELAVYFNLLDSTAESALFSSKGFAHYCREHGFTDRGGRAGTSNNYRLDTAELALLGQEILRLEKNGRPTRQQLQSLQAGDLVGRAGHFGILVQIEGELFYLESGGWVVPKLGGIPVRADAALKIFAKTGPIQVRRVLPRLPAEKLTRK
ncbi:hypothetical protein L0128_14475 [candidate division KSB1 bacterium]|nr:hypothetical protein [candidate division KSB1 bacterium]